MTLRTCRKHKAAPPKCFFPALGLEILVGRVPGGLLRKASMVDGWDRACSGNRLSAQLPHGLNSQGKSKCGNEGLQWRLEGEAAYELWLGSQWLKRPTFQSLVFPLSPFLLALATPSILPLVSQWLAIHYLFSSGDLPLLLLALPDCSSVVLDFMSLAPSQKVFWYLLPS